MKLLVDIIGGPLALHPEERAANAAHLAGLESALAEKRAVSLALLGTDGARPSRR